MGLILTERQRQIKQYGLNEDLKLGFGPGWLWPFSGHDATTIERRFRGDYESYESQTGEPTWMHLIREEIAELFASTSTGEAITEASQVAALCVSLIEHLTLYGEDAWPTFPEPGGPTVAEGER